MTNAALNTMDGIIAILKSGITDPVPNRGKGWIYPDRPRTTLAASNWPRISITQISERSAHRGIGYGQKLKNFTYDISVWAKAEDKYVVNSSDYNGTRLTTYLMDQVIDTIENVTQRNYLYNSYSVNEIDLVDARANTYLAERSIYKGTVLVRALVDT